MAENITRCPKCYTSFRISDAHLNTEKGAVRCGSCLNIFNAKENLINVAEQVVIAEPTIEQNQNSSGSETEKPQTEAKRTDEPVHQQDDETYFDDDIETDFDEDYIPDDALISDDMDETTSTGLAKGPKIGSDVKEGFDEVIFTNGDTGEYEFNLFERDAAQDDDKEENRADESWALDLLENDDDDDSDTRFEPGFDEAVEEEERHITEEFEASYYKNSFQLIGEEEQEDSSRREASPKKNKPLASDLFEDYDDMEVEEFDYSDSSALYEEPASSSQYLDAIEPEPVEFSWQRHSTLWESKALWGAGCALVGALLFAQIAWIKFDSLSVIEPYRSYYATACKFISCKLPVLIDRSKIRTTNLVVRSHPSARNALIVDAVLQNTAKFEQTFPILDLVFTNNQDKIVAARRLLPQDYLAGELAGRTNMPVKQPIHFAIEIVDPGSEAVGYKISIAD